VRRKPKANKNARAEDYAFKRQLLYPDRNKNTKYLQQIEAIQPEIVIIDSIQNFILILDRTAGSISQIRETAAELIKFARKRIFQHTNWTYY
jgi:predicted ATP-dependent serine protease